MLRLKIQGRFRAEDDLGNQVRIKSKKARALLAFLALPLGKERSRETVMALLWSERGDEQARSSLRQALSGLRKELGVELTAALRITDEFLSLDPEQVTVAPASPGEVLLDGSPSSVPITAIREVFVSEVSSRPLALQKSRPLGSSAGAPAAVRFAGPAPPMDGLASRGDRPPAHQGGTINGFHR